MNQVKVIISNLMCICVSFGHIENRVACDIFVTHFKYSFKQSIKRTRRKFKRFVQYVSTKREISRFYSKHQLRGCHAVSVLETSYCMRFTIPANWYVISVFCNANFHLNFGNVLVDIALIRPCSRSLLIHISKWIGRFWWWRKTGETGTKP